MFKQLKGNVKQKSHHRIFIWNGNYHQGFVHILFLIKFMTLLSTVSYFPDIPLSEKR